jgi:hypothetical protein
VLFGSDGPWLHPGLEMAKVKLLHLAPAEERLILGGNLIRLIERARKGPPARALSGSGLDTEISPVPQRWAIRTVQSPSPYHL